MVIGSTSSAFDADIFAAFIVNAIPVLLFIHSTSISVNNFSRDFVHTKEQFI